MSRLVLIILVLIFVAAAAYRAAFLLAPTDVPATSQISGKERGIDKRHFGTDEQMHPIENGQEMRPQW